MIHLYKDVWLDADQYGYALCTKGVYRSGKKEGETKIEAFSFHATPEQVSKKLVDLGMKELVNGDWKRAYEAFNEMHSNFVKHMKNDGRKIN